jgi:hypothetical protein
MKSEDQLLIYVAYLVFIFIKRIYDLFISIKYPQENIITSGIGYYLVTFRTILAYISITWLLSMLIFFKLNTYMSLFLYFILFSILFYLLIEKNYIKYIIGQHKSSEETLNHLKNLDTNGAIVINIVWFTMYIYVVYKIFPMVFA